MQNPFLLFLFDGFGALLSAVCLGLLLPYFNDYVGMPPRILYVLSVPAAIFAVYSLSCYFFRPDNWRPLMLRIAAANLLYCCLTIFFLLSNLKTLTGWGSAYFVAEIFIIFVLVYQELRTAAKPNDIVS